MPIREKPDFETVERYILATSANLEKALRESGMMRFLPKSKKIKDAVDKAVTSGIDPHTAVANLLKITRQEAKNLNFIWMYGGGKP